MKIQQAVLETNFYNTPWYSSLFMFSILGSVLQVGIWQSSFPHLRASKGNKKMFAKEQFPMTLVG